MKARISLTIFLLTALIGCVANHVLADADAAENNINRLSRVALRMDQEEVIQIMHAPYEKETFRVEEDRYEVWFYVTTITGLGQSRMVPKNLTPLTFRNRKLVGVGYDYYHWLQRRETRTAVRDREVENLELEEDLKKALKNKGSSSSPQPNNTPSQPKNSPSNPPQPSIPVKPSPPSQPSPQPPQTPPQKKVPPKPSNPQQPPKPTDPSLPSDLKLGPPPPTPSKQPQKQLSMSKAPEKPAETAPPKDNSGEKPSWGPKDEEINGDAMDQDFDFW